MGTARTLTPVPIALPFLSTVTYATSTAQPIGLSKDRTTVYGAPNPYHDTGVILYGSTDDGSTWTSIHTFAEPVVGIRETGDGEAIVITQDLGSTPGYIYKSSGWTASRTAATWTKVLTSTGGYFRPFWGGGHGSSFGDDAIRAGTSKYGVLCEYGAQIATSTPDPSKATHSYFTSDYGTTWTPMLDMQTRYPGVFPLHWHSASYDPWWDRIWLVYGDTVQADGTSNAQMIYSDDHGTSWNTVPSPSTNVGYQSTPMLVTPDGIVIGADNNPGYFRIARKGYRVMGALQIIQVEAASNSSAMVSMSLHQQPGGAIIGGWTAGGATVAPGIVASVDGGLTWNEVWWDEGLRNTSGGAVVVVGPTVNGRYVGNIAQGTTTDKVLRATLVTPPAGVYPGRANFTGDGATTVFTVAHGLSATPTRLYAGGMNIPTTDFTLTADATNLIFTFAVAPANTVVKRIIYRYGT